jgi:hypothetical protein
LNLINRFYTEQFAYLLAELKKVPEGQGSLLDNTLVVYCNELHTGWDHKPGPAPTVLAGHLGGRLRTGRYLDYSTTGALPYTHNHLLVSLCNVMGLPEVDKVGNLGPEGALPDLFT